MKFFNLDTPIMQKITKYASIVIMNAWWFLCCVPIFTIGASTAAMYTVLFEIRENGTATTGEFFRAFRDNFKKATLLWLILLGTLLLLAGSYWAAVCVEADMIRMGLAAIACSLFFLWLLAGNLVFPLTAYFENTVKNTLKNAVLIALRYIRKSIPCCALAILPVIIYCLSPDLFIRMLFIWLFVLAGLIAYVKTGALKPLFQEISPREEESGDTETQEG